MRHTFNSRILLSCCSVILLISAVALCVWWNRDANVANVEPSTVIASKLPRHKEPPASVQPTPVALPEATKVAVNGPEDPKTEKLSLVKRMENGKMLNPDPAKLAAY